MASPLSAERLTRFVRFFSKAVVLPPSDHPSPSNIFNIPSMAILCFFSFSIFLFVDFTVGIFFCWLLYRRQERNLELGEGSHLSGRVASSGSLEAAMANDSVHSVITLEELLPLVSLKSNRSSSRCTICLEDFADDEHGQVLPTCSHMFHLHCIVQWLRNHPTCPICRKCIFDN